MDQGSRRHTPRGYNRSRQRKPRHDGVRRRSSFEAFDRLLNVRRSFDWITDEIGKKPVEDQIAKLPAAVEAATNIVLKPGQIEMMRHVMSGERVMPFDGLNLPDERPGRDPRELAWGWIRERAPHRRPGGTDDVGPGQRAIPGRDRDNMIHEVLVQALGLPPGKLLEGMDAIIKFKKQDPND